MRLFDSAMSFNQFGVDKIRVWKKANKVKQTAIDIFDAFLLVDCFYKYEEVSVVEWEYFLKKNGKFFCIKTQDACQKKNNGVS